VAASSPGANELGPPAVDHPVVLIVDDSEKNVRLARDVLRAAGIRTLAAATGSDGIALAGERLPDVILLDLHLPDMDGIGVVRELKRRGRTAQIPVVALTALRIDQADDWLHAAGFAGYLSKPIDVRAFPGQVRSYCAPGET
jgi:two-component system, cell cycle response regulator DivK